MTQFAIPVDRAATRLSRSGSADPDRETVRLWLAEDARIATEDALSPSIHKMFTLDPKPGAPQAATGDSLRAEIKGMVRPSDWCGPAKPISEEDCKAAIQFVRDALDFGVAPPTFVSPSTVGAVGLSWKKGKNLVYVEIKNRRNALIYYQWGGPTEGPKEGLVDRKEFLPRLKRLMDRGES